MDRQKIVSWLATEIDADVIADHLAQLVLDLHPAWAKRGSHSGSQLVGCVSHSPDPRQLGICPA
jgi:hypothetical protein